MHPHNRRRGESAAYVPLRFGQHDVDFGHKHAAQRSGSAEANGETHGDYLVVWPEINWHESQPDNAGGVHGERDVFGLVEIGRDVAGLKGVEGAAENKQPVVAQWRHHSERSGVADEVHLTYGRIVVDHLRRFHDEECHDDAQLNQDQDEGDDQLGAGTHETRLLGADLLLAACKDASDAVGLGDQGRVAHGRREPNSQSLQVTVGHVRFGDEAERTQVAQTDASQDDEAQLPAGGLHHRRIVEPDED